MAAIAKRKKASGRKTVYTYVILHDAAKLSLRQAELTEERSLLNDIQAVLSVAFFVEAYLNHLGAQKFWDWKEQGKWWCPKTKLKRVSQKVGFPLRHESEEYNAFSLVFAVRKLLVHGTTEKI